MIDDKLTRSSWTWYANHHSQSRQSLQSEEPIARESRIRSARTRMLNTTGSSNMASGTCALYSNIAVLFERESVFDPH
jgi:hypothetical protein